MMAMSGIAKTEAIMTTKKNPATFIFSLLPGQNERHPFRIRMPPGFALNDFPARLSRSWLYLAPVARSQTGAQSPQKHFLPAVPTLASCLAAHFVAPLAPGSGTAVESGASIRPVEFGAGRVPGRIAERSRSRVVRPARPFALGFAVGAPWPFHSTRGGRSLVHLFFPLGPPAPAFAGAPVSRPSELWSFCALFGPPFNIRPPIHFATKNTLSWRFIWYYVSGS